MMNINEDMFNSCREILETMVNEKKEKIRRIKYYDFIDKFEKIRSNSLAPKSSKEKFDVIIFTIVPIEYETLNQVLDFVPPQIPDHELNALWYYKYELQRIYNPTKPLNVLITLVGIAGDIDCSIAVSRTLQKFSCDLAILCGIAAGLESKIRKYSTVIADSITNYEYQRIEKDGVTYRPRTHDLDIYFKRTNSKVLLTDFQSEWGMAFKEYFKSLGLSELEFPISNIEETVCTRGVIASGAKLIADGKYLLTLRDELPTDKGIIAAEMEGSGFCPACIEYKTKWLVFRGISDYGDDDKNDNINKKYQKIAAASAALSMKHYLQKLYRTPEERGDEDLIF